MYDIVCVLNCEGDAMNFFVILLKIFNIKFTFEKQDGGKLAFLEILISKEKDKFEPVPFAKKINWLLHTNFTSFTPFSYGSPCIGSHSNSTKKKIMSYVKHQY